MYSVEQGMFVCSTCTRIMCVVEY